MDCNFKEIADINFSLMCAARKGKLDDIQALVAQGADVNYVTDKYLSLIDAEVGDTPLMLAAGSGCKDSLLFLIEQGAKVNYRRKEDEVSALEYSIFHSILKFNRECTQLLIQYDAEVGPAMNELFDYIESEMDRFDIRIEVMSYYNHYYEQRLLNEIISNNENHDGAALVI